MATIKKPTSKLISFIKEAGRDLGLVQKSASATGFQNIETLLGKGNLLAQWKSTEKKTSQLLAYTDIPEVNQPINYIAECLANGIISIRDRKTWEILPDHPLQKVFDRPNPLQGKAEFWEQAQINKGIFGNSYIYTPMPSGFSKMNSKSVTTMYVMPALNMDIIGTGKIFNQVRLSDIIKNYELTLGGSKTPFKVDEILHRSNPRPDYKTLEGQSKISLVDKAISNLYNVYEADNILISRHGSVGIFTNDQSDVGGGWLPLDNTEKENVQKEFSKYGLSGDKFQYIITSMSLKYQSTIANVKDLELSEKHKRYRNTVFDTFKFPSDLFSSEKGSTYANKSESEKQLYQNVIIPEAQGWIDEFNRHFDTESEGIEIIISFDHLPVMQADSKDMATTLRLRNIYLQEQWKNGLITRNQWLMEMDMDIVNKPEFDLYIYQLNPGQGVILPQTALPSTT